MQRSRYFAWVLSVLVLQQGVFCLEAQAQPSEAVVSRQLHNWSSLSPAQQTALQPLSESWREIEPARKRKWIEIAEKFPTLSPIERARIQGRMTQWAQISSSERTQVRLNYQEAQQITPRERNAKWEAYVALPSQERESFVTKRTAPQDPNPYRLRSSRTSGASTTNLANGTALGLSSFQNSQLKIVTDKNLIDVKTLLPKKNSLNNQPLSSMENSNAVTPSDEISKK